MECIRHSVGSNGQRLSMVSVSSPAFYCSFRYRRFSCSLRANCGSDGGSYSMWYLGHSLVVRNYCGGMSYYPGGTPGWCDESNDRDVISLQRLNSAKGCQRSCGGFCTSSGTSQQLQSCRFFSPSSTDTQHAAVNYIVYACCAAGGIMAIAGLLSLGASRGQWQ